MGGEERGTGGQGKEEREKERNKDRGKRTASFFASVIFYTENSGDSVDQKLEIKRKSRCLLSIELL